MCLASSIITSSLKPCLNPPSHPQRSFTDNMIVTRLFLRIHSLPLTTLLPKLTFPKLPLPVSLCSTSTTTTPALTQTRIQDPALSYGPSLHKGTKPQPEHEQQDQQDDIIDEQSFTRVFDLAALRVPAKDCFALERRLRGHLLNWPRVRNIARVPGDEVDPEVIDLLGRQGQGFSTEEEEENLVSLERRIYGKAEGDGDVLSPVLYREKLARTFNSRGYVRFRNLAKISRPKRKKKRNEEEERGGGNKGIGKNETALVEVVEGEEEGEELKGLLGDEFKGKTRKWRGSTRLLLLDEQYAARDVEDLPEAIKVKRLFPTL